MTMTDQPTDERDALDTVTGVCYFAVVRALQFAAMRSKAKREQVPRNMPRHLVHTRINLLAAGDDWQVLLRGAWETLPVVLHGNTDPYAQVCEQYTRDLITSRRHPDRLALRRLLAEV